MDNIENNQAPVGAEGATSSQDNAGNDTQTAKATNSASDGNAVEAGQASTPWDNDPKFKGKTPDDIYKAYKEAEKLSGQLSRKAQVANLLEEKFGVTPEQLQAQIEQQEEQKRQEYYAKNPLAPVLDEVKELRQRLEKQDQEKALNDVRHELDSFIKQNPEYEQQRSKIEKLALTPGIGFNPETGEDVSFDEIAREYFGEVRSQGQQDAYKKIDTKMMTKATTASKSGQKQKVGYSALKDLPLSERLRAFEQMME